jgi:hypothetical protein
MEPLVDLAPGAEDNLFAVRLAERVRENVELHPSKRRSFRALRGAVQVVAEDTGEAFTLRFDLGRLVLHDGTIGLPTMTIAGSTEALVRFFDQPLVPELPLPFRRSDGPERGSVAASLLDGGVRVYGLLAHPRMLLRLHRILSPRG